MANRPPRPMTAALSQKQREADIRQKIRERRARTKAYGRRVARWNARHADGGKRSRGWPFK